MSCDRHCICHYDLGYKVWRISLVSSKTLCVRGMQTSATCPTANNDSLKDALLLRRFVLRSLLQEQIRKNSQSTRHNSRLLRHYDLRRLSGFLLIILRLVGRFRFLGSNGNRICWRISGAAEGKFTSWSIDVNLPNCWE